MLLSGWLIVLLDASHHAGGQEDQEPQTQSNFHLNSFVSFEPAMIQLTNGALSFLAVENDGLQPSGRTGVGMRLEVLGGGTSLNEIGTFRPEGASRVGRDVSVHEAIGVGVVDVVAHTSPRLGVRTTSISAWGFTRLNTDMTPRSSSSVRSRL